MEVSKEQCNDKNNIKNEKQKQDKTPEKTKDPMTMIQTITVR